jgi:hypothetical protein|tara:strand:- start:3911 stop:4315 length:405 start_codon:yes stop_codon:yes gene_type:complete
VPVQKTSQGFKDISLSFKRHPVTNDVLPLKNEDAIKRSVQNLVRTQVGEVFFNELIGTKVEAALFELASDDFIDPIKNEIETVITNFEPRVLLRTVQVNAFPDSNAVDIKIGYDIVGISAPSQSINFVLEPTRL